MRYTKNIGDNGETFAAKILEEQGFRILERNFFSQHGEIDIVAVKDCTLHFIEVKTRTSDSYGFPSDSITEAKKKRMKKSAECYMSRRRPFWRGYTIDVFEVMTNLIENCVE